MLIPKYWAKASQQIVFPKRLFSKESKSGMIFCWRWSESSEADARRQAQSALAKKVENILRGKKIDDGYFEKAVREEVLKEFRDSKGNLVAAVTRSSLGFRVLNTSEIAFVDMDYDLSPEPWIFALFKKKQSPADLRAQWENAAIERVQSSFKNLNLSGRLYRTANGLRAMVTSQTIHAQDPLAQDLLYQCGSDALYKKLCLAQNSFRARLTPKPRRIQMSSPGVKFPFEQESEKKKVLEWTQQYETLAGEFATCEFVKNIGNLQPILKNFQEVVDLHDQETHALEKNILK